MASQSVVIVEDEQDIAQLIRFHVEREGFEAHVAMSGLEGFELVRTVKPSLILLDIMLPDLDGLEVCKRLKRAGQLANIPVIMVSARGEESDVVVGLELGAEDYVTKPFSPRVLMARIRSVLRRGAPAEADGRITVAGGALEIDPARHVARMNGEDMELTLTQFRLLYFLASRPGFVRTRDQIVSAVRGEDVVLSSRAIDVHVAALRQKLGEYADLIETVRGVGYRLAEHATNATS